MVAVIECGEMERDLRRECGGLVPLSPSPIRAQPPSQRAMRGTVRPGPGSRPRAHDRVAPKGASKPTCAKRAAFGARGMAAEGLGWLCSGDEARKE
jgi:hypothetical protein